MPFFSVAPQFRSSIPSTKELILEGKVNVPPDEQSTPHGGPRVPKGNSCKKKNADGVGVKKAPSFRNYNFSAEKCNFYRSTRRNPLHAYSIIGQFDCRAVFSRGFHVVAGF